MQKKQVYLTFPTDPETSFILKDIAHRMGKTQPELINEICKDFIENLLSYLTEKNNETAPAPGPAGAGEPEAEK